MNTQITYPYSLYAGDFQGYITAAGIAGYTVSSWTQNSNTAVLTSTRYLTSDEKTLLINYLVSLQYTVTDV